MEIEEEEVVEVEIPSMTPVSETAWKFESALAGDSPSRIPDATYIEELMHKFVLPLISMDIE